MREYELLLASGEEVWSEGETPERAALNYAKAHAGAVVVATRRWFETNTILIGDNPTGMQLLGSRRNRPAWTGRAPR